MFVYCKLLVLIIAYNFYTAESHEPVSGKCEPVPVSNTAGMLSVSMGTRGMCGNVRDIAGFTRCRGHCESLDTYNKLTRKYDNDQTCRCCRVAHLSLVPVVLTCEDGSEVEHHVPSADQCSCRRCGDDWYPEEPTVGVEVPTIKY